MNEEKNHPPASALPPVLTEKAAVAAFAKDPLVPVLTDTLPKEEKKATPAARALDTLPWQELEDHLTVRIRQQVAQRLNFVLDDNITRHVSVLLEKAVTLLVDEARNDMQKTLEVIITHAISTEMQRLRKKVSQEETPPPSNR